MRDFIDLGGAAKKRKVSLPLIVRENSPNQGVISSLEKQGGGLALTTFRPTGHILAFQEP
jgi:hypothetical protein